ncbi:restriction endonuclease subunit S [Carnobacterium sp. FSL W8-0810]|uniref:restriction endonuclease subunit S n=1 Tax=Carnobacterium sp. FSL W8-0810 TaxID=2954705 RepID=UPI0030F569D3
MLNKEKQTPKIRFDKFNLDWERVKLGDGTSRIGDGLHGTPQYSEKGNIAFINGNNLVNGKIVITKKTKFVQEEQQSKKDKLLNSNTILMSINGTIGNLAYYAGEKIMLGKSTSFLEVTRFNKNFMYQLLQTNKIKSHFLNNLTGSTIKNLGLKTIRETPCSVPTLEEQIKIGYLFKQLDDIVTLQQQLLNDHKQLKKAMLQKMFPQKGESVPRVRFAGFVSKWNEDKIENLLIERNERSGEGELISVTTNFGVVKAADLKRTDNSSKDKSNYKKVEKGDIAYNSMRMWQGASGLSKYTGIVSPAYTIIIPKENVSPLFISYLFKLPSIIQTFQANSQGLTSDTWNLKYPMLKKIKIKVPELKEQQKISIFFKQLDKTIDFHEKKLETYRELKKAMLQKMFV